MMKDDDDDDDDGDVARVVL